MVGMRIIAERAERSAKIAAAHRLAHEAARMLSAASTTVELYNAELKLRQAADMLNRVRGELSSAEYREAAHG